MQNRIYLECPFDEKDQCKDLGACWDKDKKKWFITDAMDPLSFQKWWPDRVKPTDNNYFVNEERIEELETTIEELANEVSALQTDNIDLYLYKCPEPAMTEFKNEIDDWKRIKENQPGLWSLFRPEFDPETVAFYYLSDDSRVRLIN